MKCSKSSVKVPELLVVDLRQGVLGVEWIEGWSVREVLGGGQEDEDGPWVEEGEDEPVEATDGDQTEEERRDEEMKHRLETAGVDEGQSRKAVALDIRRATLTVSVFTLDEMLGAIGAEIAKMHLCEVIHGDLTTSNMMVRLLPNASSPSPPFEVVRLDKNISAIHLSHLKLCPHLGLDRFWSLFVLHHVRGAGSRSLRAGASLLVHSPSTKTGIWRRRHSTFCACLGGIWESYGRKGEKRRLESRGEEVGRG